MKINDSDIKKIERLADAWAMEMPDERFFVNLPAKVLEEAGRDSRPWWSLLGVGRLWPAGGAAAFMVLLLAVGMVFLEREVRGTDRLLTAAAEWSSESAGWDGIDRVLAEADAAGISGLHSYLDASGLETAASAVDQYPSSQDVDYVLDTDLY